ncbi:YigZ family protein [Desulfuribacillus stibiiarsenatis]|uniref:YigZ family protein n=1 Tax=Desulfuribacillus stibiiarsenatis TaxID=1390249 RepID=A0A1E5L677_9FIRM|nr:YigZ family protein [Desulfuribacillus stibiiarsenatis]
MPLYKTVKKSDEETLIIKKSKFISYVSPVKNEVEANHFIEMIRKKHWDATHNCYAYVIGENSHIQKASDDGEPSGTAGKPMLEVLKKEGVLNTVVVVTRYFGGILLGAGGLIRAYSQATTEGLQKAGIVERELHTEILLDVDYTWIGKLENELYNKGYPVKNVEYAETVRFTILAKYMFEQQLEKFLVDVTNGQAVINRGATLYVDKLLI